MTDRGDERRQGGDLQLEGGEIVLTDSPGIPVRPMEPGGPSLPWKKTMGI